MESLLDRVRSWADKHELLPPGSCGVVAFSGGPDSLCLLDLLRRLAPERALSIEAIHVDHRLQPGSGELAALARARAEQLGVSVRVVAVDPPLAPGGDLQQRARRARQQQLLQAAGSGGWIATGHTADDQAETVLLRLLRGAGPHGLAAMAPRRQRWVRPLLAVQREEVESYLAARDLQPLRDPSNASRRFARNRARHELMPRLRRENPAIVAVLCRTADSCREEDAALEQLAHQRWEEAFAPRHGLQLAGLRQLPDGLLHRVLAIDFENGPAGTRRGLTRAHLQRLAALVRRRHGSGRLSLPGATAERSYDALRWEPVSPRLAQRSPLDALELTGPGRYRLSDGRWLELAVGRAEGAPLDELPALRVEWPLVARGPVPGDRIAIGGGHSRKVSRVLMDHRVPRASRAGACVIESGGEVALIVGVRRAAGLAVMRGRPALRLHLRN